MYHSKVIIKLISNLDNNICSYIYEFSARSLLALSNSMRTGSLKETLFQMGGGLIPRWRVSFTFISIQSIQIYTANTDMPP